jgi:hypothetical protein
VVALFAPILSFWWRFLPPLYDFDGAFCHHFLCSDFIVILFRFQISKTGAQNGAIFEFWGRFSPPNSESGGTKEILLKYSLDLPYTQTEIYLLTFLTFPYFQGFLPLKILYMYPFPLFLPLWDNHKGNFIIQLFNHCLPLYQEVLRKSALLPL